MDVVLALWHPARPAITTLNQVPLIDQHMRALGPLVVGAEVAAFQRIAMAEPDAERKPEMWCPCSARPVRIVELLPSELPPSDPHTAERRPVGKPAVAAAQVPARLMDPQQHPWQHPWS